MRCREKNFRPFGAAADGWRMAAITGSKMTAGPFRGSAPVKTTCWNGGSHVPPVVRSVSKFFQWRNKNF
jgi:hypothetical protein